MQNYYSSDQIKSSYNKDLTNPCEDKQNFISFEVEDQIPLWREPHTLFSFQHIYNWISQYILSECKLLGLKGLTFLSNMT